MSYDPNDQVVTWRQVLAGWILCLGIAGLAVALTAEHHSISAVQAVDSSPIAGPAMGGRMTGTRIPHFVTCATEEADAVTTARGPASPPDPCG
jgi:hypothetical protein